MKRLIIKNDITKIRILPTYPVIFKHEILHRIKKDGSYEYFACERENCFVCHEVKINWNEYEEESDKDKKANLYKLAYAISAFHRYTFAVIVRGREDEGPFLIDCGIPITRKIIAGVMSHPCPPPKLKWWQFAKRLYRWLTGYIPPYTALDVEEGVDFIILRNYDGANRVDFSDSHYARKRSKLGNPDQIANWLETASKAMNEIKYETFKKSEKTT